MPSRIEYIEDVIDRQQPLENAGDRKRLLKAMMSGRIPGFRPRNYLRPSARRVVEFINTGSRESEMELDGLVRNAGAAKIVPVDGAKKSNNEPGKDHPSGFIQVTDDLAATSLAQTSPYW